MYDNFKQRHQQYNHPHKSDMSLRTSYWGPVLEISLAYDHVVRCTPAYTQMAVDGIINSIPPGSIYFGGTDPGRGLPTAFCKSHADADPFYTLTQNALADGTYLDYLRRTYGPQRELLGQMAEACRADDALQVLNTNYTTAVAKLESMNGDENVPQWEAANQAVTDLWQRRDEHVSGVLAGVQRLAGDKTGGPKTLYIPTVEDSQGCFQDYVEDAQKRLANHQLKPGENVTNSGGQIRVSGQVAVMEINARIVRIIFDKNPGHEFYIEESFPLDWMYPYLEPHGLIMKINREPVGEMSETVVRQDHDFWQARVNQMIGDWLTDQTSLKQVIAFGEKVYLHHDLDGFTGDPGFVQNDYATRMFSKWRSSLAGLYAWRAENAATDAEKKRMAIAADRAFRQAVALCPDSPEVVYRYANFLKQQHRDADAKLVLGMLGHFNSAKSASAAGPVFQIRLALDVPTDNTEPMRLVSKPGSTAPAETMYVAKEILLDQSAIQSAQVVKSQQGNPQIEVSFSDAGGTKFAHVTGQHLKQRLAMVIDGRLSGWLPWFKTRSRVARRKSPAISATTRPKIWWRKSTRRRGNNGVCGRAS